MNRMTNWFAGFLLAAAPLAFGQEPQIASRVPADALATQQLVAWTSVQKPQPAPQPLPPPDKPMPQPDPPAQKTQPSPAPQASDAPASQSFTGKIVKDGGKYILKVASNTAYQLDQQDGVSRYENQDVKVVGNLDTNSNTIRVIKIELLS
jgi:hypothetical protein